MNQSRVQLKKLEKIFKNTPKNDTPFRRHSVEATTTNFMKGKDEMKNQVKVSITKEPKHCLVSTKKVSIREKILRLFFGPIKDLTLIIAGDNVELTTVIDKPSLMGEKDA